MGKTFNFDAVVKADAAKMQLSGTVYKANSLDTQGEFMTAEELERAAHRALAGGVAVDLNHDGRALRKEHASVVESYVADGAWRATIQLSKDAWSQLIETDKVRAFSIGGKAPRRVAKLDGKQATEIFDAQVSFISLVPKGANGEQFVAKSDDAPAWAKALIESNKALSARVDAQAAKLAEIQKSRSGGRATVTDIRKQLQAEEEAERVQKIEHLTRRHRSLSKQLEKLWKHPDSAIGSGQSAMARERSLSIELAKIETELDALGREENWGGSSAFDFRGGTSTAHDSDSVFPLGDSYLEPKQDLKKAEEQIDLSGLYI